MRLNVGFLLKEGIGYHREIEFAAPVADLADDLHIEQLTGKVSLTRTAQGLYAHGQLRAKVQYECVRCLQPFEQPVSSRIAELYHFPPETAPEGALIVGDDAHLDFTPIVREDMLVSIPIQALCRPDCKGLCAECGQNLNEGPCACPAAAIDPRLAPLAQLLKAQENNTKNN